MTINTGPGGQPPAAWVWSQYHGVSPAEPVAAEASDPAPATAATPASPAPAEHSSLIGLGLAAAVVVIAGLTWLFTTGTASNPAPAETPPAATESLPQKSEAVTPAPEPAAAPAPATAAAPTEEAKPAAPAPAPAKKHKKHKHEG